ncbi:PREDICTED: kinesin-like protein 1 [Camelina sativa]|uniref:Kinesin-like protein 1 n=1 Tax=Camelina sativa TaxID=90675 RepID=A0ABM1RGX8_CAMSA|nr:PREDICTED: kinesin-like protein 1 [Camelina sativa]
MDSGEGSEQVSVQEEESENSVVSPANGQTLPNLQKIVDFSDKIKLLKDEHDLVSNQMKEITNCALLEPEMSRALQLLIQYLTDKHGTLENQYLEESSERKRLYNEVIKFKGNIRVFCRCRPLNQAEIASGCASVAEFDPSQENKLKILSSDSLQEAF